MRKLIFVDVDGTLTYPMDHVPLSAKKACQAARKAGNLLFLCTGRALIQIAPKILDIGFDGVISSGGAEIYIDGKLVRGIYFDTDLLHDLTAFLDAREAAYVYEGAGRVLLGPYLFPFYDKIAKKSPQAAITAKLAKEFWQKVYNTEDSRPLEKVCKVIFVAEPGDSLYGEVAAEFAGRIELFGLSIPSMKGGEASAKGAHKGAAVLETAKMLDVPREAVYAFGDSDNDRTMIEAAGVGIAMGNAEDGIKAAADDVADHVARGGLAKAFAKHGLI